MGAKAAKGKTICFAQIRLDDPAFVQLDEEYAEEFDRRWQEHREKEREAERKLHDFVITF